MNECARDLDFAGGRHVFNLNRPDVLAVLAGTGPKMARVRSGVFRLDPLMGENGNTPAACLRRFDQGSYSIADVERIITYGLWGGGMSLSDADAMVAQHVRGQPLGANAAVAFEIIAGLFMGAAYAGAST